MLGETGEIGGGGLRGRGEDGREVVHTGSAPPTVPVVNTQTRNLSPSYYRFSVPGKLCCGSGYIKARYTRELSCLILTFFSSLETHWKATSWLTGKTVARQEAASPTTAGSVGLPVHLSMEKSRPMIIVTEAGAKDQEGDEAAVERVQPGLARAEFRTLQSSTVYITPEHLGAGRVLRHRPHQAAQLAVQLVIRKMIKTSCFKFISPDVCDL